MARYFDEFAVGDTFETGSLLISDAESLAFAEQFDPQPFHLDEEAAKASLFRGLTSSGWHTAAITMRLVVDSGVLRETGCIGTGVDDLRWLAPVKPGDTLRVRGEIIDKAPWPGSNSRGTLRVRLHTVNQDDIVVMSQIDNLIVPMRPA